MTMRNVETLQYTKSDVPNPYYAVFGGQPDFLGFSELTCEPGSSLCYVETLLKAEWFQNQGFVEVTGVATLQFGQGSSERRLQQNNDGDDLGSFVLNFPISKFIADDWKTTSLSGGGGGSRNSSSGVSMTQSMILIATSFALIVEWIFLIWIRSSRRNAGMNATPVNYHNEEDVLVKKKSKGFVGDDDPEETGTKSFILNKKSRRPRSGSKDSCCLTVDSGDEGWSLDGDDVLLMIEDDDIESPKNISNSKKRKKKKPSSSSQSLWLSSMPSSSHHYQADDENDDGNNSDSQVDAAIDKEERINFDDSYKGIVNETKRSKKKKKKKKEKPSTSTLGGTK